MVSKTMKKLNMTTQAEFDYGGIPPNLRKRGLFCLYRLERKTPNAVKPDKVPYKLDGTRADPSNPADFCFFDEALAAYTSGGFDGIGIGCFAPISMTDKEQSVSPYVVSTSNTFLSTRTYDYQYHTSCK